MRATLFSDIDDCVDHACLNGGSCVDQINKYACQCTEYYRGLYCEKGGVTLLI